MILKKIEVTVKQGHITNCYIFADEKSKEAMIIDPGAETQEIIEMIKVLNVNVKYIVLTHCHGDHVSGAGNIKNNVGGKILIHRLDSEGLKNGMINLAYFIGLDKIEIEADSRLDDNDLIHIGDIKFRIIHTPGHTKGSICLYSEKERLLFSGDTLFKGTWGRTDLPTSNFVDIINSITNKLIVLPDDTIVYPGHGRITRIKDEKPIYLNLSPRLD